MMLMVMMVTTMGSVLDPFAVHPLSCYVLSQSGLQTFERGIIRRIEQLLSLAPTQRFLVGLGALWARVWALGAKV